LRPDFLHIYRDHVWQVYGYLAYRVGNRPEAEDLTQLTFERALRAWDRFDSRRASITTWLFAIARNALIDHQRREGTRRTESLDIERLSATDLPSEPGPEEGLGLDPELAAALNRLSDRDRSVVALRFGGDLSTAEIAALLDLSVANVQQILSRTLRRLRDDLEKRPSVSKAGGSAKDPLR
jgi:RNA polymerase sigma factor (sigma-70 family)